MSDMFSHYVAVLKRSKDQNLPSLKPVRKLSSFVVYNSNSSAIIIITSNNNVPK